MKKSTNNLQTGCGCIPYLVMAVMLASPAIMLIRAIASAPTPEHRAAVEAMPPDPLADWVVIGLCAMFLAFTLLVVLLKSGQTVEYDPPAVDLPDALWMAAHTDLTTSIPMGDVTPEIRRNLAAMQFNPSPTAPTPLAGPKIAENAPARTGKTGKAGER